MKTKLISNFDQFERIYENWESGVTVNTDAINESIFSGIMNFFSRVFGGKIEDLDQILRKYKKNESEYWTKWANANHEYNKAALQRDSAESQVDKRKNLEMMERASQLIKQVTKSRHDVNDALDRQAMILIRSNNRLREYWGIKKAKADEAVAKDSYTSLKKTVDSDTLDDLYDRIQETQDKAKAKIAKMPKGTMTIEFGDYKDASDHSKEVPMSKFGIHDLDDFIFAEDELWNERIKLMPQNNLNALAVRIKEAIADIKSDTDKELLKLKKQLEVAKGDTRTRINTDWKHVQEYSDEDLHTLEIRLEQLTEGGASVKQPIVEPKKPKEANAFEARIEEHKDKIANKLNGVSDKELDFVMDDMLALYNKIPAGDKDEEKKENIRMVQLLDFAADIYKYRQANKIIGAATGSNLGNLYVEFKKEFPR